MNTAIRYMYRDADNYKTGATVIVAGTFSAADLDQIFEKLDEGLYFIPGQVKMQNLQYRLQKYDKSPRHSKEVDHPWHELTRSGIKETEELPTNDLTASQLVTLFRDVVWDDNYQF